MLSLAQPEQRADATSRRHRRVIEDHAAELVSRARSVRRAPLHFAAGASITLLPLGIVGVALAPAVVAGLAVGVVSTGLAIGFGARALAPRALLGKAEREGIDREIAEVARGDLSTQVQPPPAHDEGLPRRTGVLFGVPSECPFVAEPVLAARLVGRVRGHVVDDAWFTPGGLSLAPLGTVRPSHGETVPATLPAIALAWLATPPTQRLDLGSIAPSRRAALDDYLAERGVASLEGASLTVCVIRSGDVVTVAGTPSRRAVSDGYRGQVEVEDLSDAVLEAVESYTPVAVPGPFVPPSLRDEVAARGDEA